LGEHLAGAKELNEDFGLNLSDYGARWYNAALGRWSSIDRFSEKYKYSSPFSYTTNRPINFTDINGDSLGVSSASAYQDVVNLVDRSFRERVKMSSTGDISLDFTGMSDDDREAIIQLDPGTNLLNDLVSSPSNYQYTDGDVEISAVRSEDKGPASNDPEPISNLSVTDRNIGTDLSGKGKKPASGVDGFIRVSKNVSFFQGQYKDPSDLSSPIQATSIPLNRSSVVFHELAESYERTDKKQPYTRKDGTGAHQNAAKREGNAYGNPYPGVAIH
jgi:RHS repeat-associated protein